MSDARWLPDPAQRHEYRYHDVNAGDRSTRYDTEHAVLEALAVPPGCGGGARPRDRVDRQRSRRRQHRRRCDCCDSSIAADERARSSADRNRTGCYRVEPVEPHHPEAARRLGWVTTDPWNQSAASGGDEGLPDRFVFVAEGPQRDATPAGVPSDLGPCGDAFRIDPVNLARLDARRRPVSDR